MRDIWNRFVLCEAAVADPGAGAETGGLSDAIKQAISGAVAQAVAPLQTAQTELKNSLDGLKQPQSQNKGSQLYGGGSAAIRQGEDAMTSRGYSFAKLFFALGSREGWQHAKVEKEVHDKLYDAYGALGEGTVFAPLGGVHLQRVDAKFAAEVRQMVRQGVAHADPAEMGWVLQQLQRSGVIRQDLSTWDDTAGAALLGPIQQGELIDLLRAKEIFSQAGCTEFTLPPNGRIQWPRITGDASSYWVGEGVEITESNISTGMLNMTAKKLAAICDFPNELLRFATMSVEALVRNMLAEQQARKLDTTFLTATGSDTTPKGLINETGINTLTASVTGTNGDTLEPHDVDLAAATVEEQNIDTNGFTFLCRPMLHAKLKNRRADAVSANDQKGAYLFKDQLDAYKWIRSTSVPKDRVDGSSSVCTMLIGGVFREYLIGRVGVVEFAVNPFTQTNFRNDLTSIRSIQHVDGKARRPEAFVYIDDLLAGYA
jgi:HK97 family phage major capsid protein